MSRFDTGNPIGSADPRDRDDNSKNLDEAVNSINSETWTDRFGVERLTIQGALNRFNDVIIAGGQIFESEEAGRDAVQDGQYYYVVSDDPDVSRELWRRIDVDNSELIAEDPSADGLRTAVEISNAAIDLASRSSEVSAEFHNNDAEPLLHAVTDSRGNGMAAWGGDGYQKIQTRGEFYSHDDQPAYARVDKNGEIIFAADEKSKIKQSISAEFHAHDDQPAYARVDKNNVVFYAIDIEGKNVVGGGSGEALEAPDDVVLRQNATGRITQYDLPLKLSAAEAEALSDADRALREWYYVDGTLLHRDDLPAATLQVFDAGADFLTGDVASISIDEQAGVISVTSDTGLSGYSARYVMFKAIGQSGRRTEFVINNQSQWSGPLDTSRHILTWSDDLNGDNWRSFDNVISDTDNNQWKVSNNFDFGNNTVYLAGLPHYSYGRVQRKNSEWMRNRYTRPTESAVNGFSIGTLDARISARLSKSLPESPQYAFKVGTGVNVIVLTSGVHSDERPGFYQLEGAMELIISDTDEAKRLRDTFTFYVYPAVNGQGLMAGAQRWEPEDGGDANRMWGVAEPSQTQLAQMYLNAFELDLTGADIAATIDFHSTAARSPNTQEAAQIWYDVANETIQETAFLEVMKGFRSYMVVNNPGTAGTGMRTGISERYGSKVTFSSEFTHAATETVNTWRQWGIDIIRGMYSIKDTL